MMFEGCVLLLYSDIHSDITVESGVFAGCNFEADTCEWTDISIGQFVWTRDQNGTITANTGPSVDHTTGTELGKNIWRTSTVILF